MRIMSLILNVLKLNLIFILIFLFQHNSFAQSVKDEKLTVYSYNHALETPLTVGMFYGAYLGFDQLKKKDRLDLSTINSLNVNDVWFFDRIALKQDPSFRLSAHKISDWGLNISIALPGLLALDKNIRSEWLDLLFIYLETQAITNMNYAWGLPQWTHRIRPMIYYDEVTMEEKLDSGTTDSFFSGHIANTAAASFFMAKVYCDFHPELGKKKWLIYGAAMIPPAFVGYLRYRALKHYPTDLLIGAFIGASLGILIPELHRNKEKKNVNVMPMTGPITGLRLSYQIRYK